MAFIKKKHVTKFVIHAKYCWSQGVWIKEVPLYMVYIYLGRDRWVYYIRKDYDASQVAPEWYVHTHYTYI